jgi:hypothetical protein
MGSVARRVRNGMIRSEAAWRGRSFARLRRMQRDDQAAVMGPVAVAKLPEPLTVKLGDGVTL